MIAALLAVLAWFPLQPGAAWIYEHETVTALVPRPEGTVIQRAAKVVEGRPGGGWPGTGRSPDYLLSEDCLYPLYGGLANRREVSPDFCFPLAIGKHWQAPASNEYAWTVVGVGCGDAGFCPDSVWASDYHLVATQASSGGTDHVWFREGVGITGERWWHNGTYTEIRVRLVKFTQP